MADSSPVTTRTIDCGPAFYFDSAFEIIIASLSLGFGPSFMLHSPVIQSVHPSATQLIISRFREAMKQTAAADECYSTVVKRRRNKSINLNPFLRKNRPRGRRAMTEIPITPWTDLFVYHFTTPRHYRHKPTYFWPQPLPPPHHWSMPI